MNVTKKHILRKKNSIFPNKNVRKVALVYIFLCLFNVWLNRIQLEFCIHSYCSICCSFTSRHLWKTILHACKRMRVISKCPHITVKIPQEGPGDLRGSPHHTWRSTMLDHALPHIRANDTARCTPK